MQIDGRSYEIIGVMPSWFRGVSDRAEAWIPFTMGGTAEDMAERGNRGFAVLARLKPGATQAGAQAELDGISKRLEKAYPATNEGRAVEVSPLDRELFGDVRKPLMVLLCAVGFVLLIACTNVANLMLARSEGAAARDRLAGRARRRPRPRALPTDGGKLRAGRCRMRRRTAFGALGRARADGRAARSRFPAYIQPGIDLRVALFTVVIAGACGVLLGLAPAVQVRAGNLGEAFKTASSHAAGAAGAAGSAPRWWWRRWPSPPSCWWAPDS